jgi:hypothetical protein
VEPLQSSSVAFPEELGSETSEHPLGFETLLDTQSESLEVLCPLGRLCISLLELPLCRALPRLDVFLEELIRFHINEGTKWMNLRPMMNS